MPEARIARGPSGRFRELHPTLVDQDRNPIVIQEFPQRVWLEHEGGVIKALHRIDFSWGIHMEGGDLTTDKPLRELVELTAVLGGDSTQANRRPATAVDDNDIVDNFDFNPVSKTLTRRP